MKIQISKRFSKDVQAITDQRILQKIRQILEQASRRTILPTLPIGKP